MKTTTTVAVSNQKGGVGKSTITVLLASYLCYEKGVNLAVIDCDTHQLSLSRMRERDMQTVEKSDYYKQLLISQYERIQRKAYPIVESSPSQARDKVEELLQQSSGLDLVLVDLPGSVAEEGVFSTIINMDYILTPIVADRMVMQSALTFATAVLDFKKNKSEILMRDLFFVWNKVDRRVSTEVFDTYSRIIDKLKLNVLETVLSESKRFDKELSIGGGRNYFRCTLLPPPAKMLKGSNIDLLADELCKRLNL